MLPIKLWYTQQSLCKDSNKAHHLHKHLVLDEEVHEHGGEGGHGHGELQVGGEICPLPEKSWIKICENSFTPSLLDNNILEQNKIIKITRK